MGLVLQGWDGNISPGEESQDMGILPGLKGGGHYSLYDVRAFHPGDHLPSGRFAECAFASNDKWEKATFLPELRQAKLAAHQEGKILKADTLAYSDLRSQFA